MARRGWTWGAPVLLLGIALLAACGRGGGGAPSPSAGQATLGAAGGVVQGPDGVTVEVPAGALASDVTLRVARDGTGAPPPPTGFEAFGSTYQFTPHGQLFEVPATVSLPVNVAALPADAAPLFFHAQPGDQWIQIVDAQLDGDRLRAPSLSFSYGNVYIGYFDASVPLAQRHTVKQFALVAPTGLPLANGWLPTVNQPTTVTIRVEMDPGFVSRRCSASPTIELARAIKTVTDNIPPLSLAYQAVGNQQLSGSYQLDFNVALDHNHNGTNWFIAKFDCPLRPGGPFVEGRRWFLFGYVRVKVQVPVPPGAPSITQHPQSITVAEGASASFNVVASAPDTLVVQWQRSNDGGATWNTVASGVNLTSYTLDPVQSSDHGARFRANVCNQLGMQLNCIASNVATLTVTSAATAPVFITQPQSIAVQSGQTASFTAVASGNPAPSVQWYRVASPDVAVGAPCAAGTGATTSCTYTTPALAESDSGTQYYALAQNTVGNTQSNTVTVTVTAASVAPSITTQPTDQTVTVGGSATFTVVADGTAPLSYQWYRNGQPVGGASGASITLTNVQLSENGDQYYVVVSNSEGAATSVTVTLTVTPSAGACNVPQLLESGAGHAGTPQIALDASGNAIAVWAQNDGTFFSIYANRFAAGSGWGSAQLIENLVGEMYQPRIAMDSGGNAIAVWSGADRVLANGYAAGGGWGTAQLLASSSGNPDVAMDPSGDAIAVWQRFDGSTDSIYASHYFSGSGWSAPQLIENGAGSVNNARIVVDGNGNAIAVWSQSNGTSYNLTANRYTQGIGWGTAQPIEALSREADEADIAMNASGDAVVVWRDRIQNGNSVVDAPVYAVRYTPGSGWGTVQRLDSGTNYGYVPDVPQVAIDAQGNAIAVWRDYDGAGHRIYARRYVAGSGWGALEQLQSPTGSNAWEPDVAMDANGNAIVVWMQWQTTTFGIFGNRYTPGSGWGGATLLADATNDVGWPRVALNGSGTAIAVWHEGDGTTYNVKAVRCP